MNHYKISDIFKGQEESFNVLITEDMMSSFHEITGDSSPIHIDKEYACNLGFNNRVVYGMLTASFYSTLVGVYLPGKYALLQNVDISFNKPVYTGDHLTIKGKVSAVHDRFKQIEIDAFILNQNKLKVSKALIKVGIHE